MLYCDEYDKDCIEVTSEECDNGCCDSCMYCVICTDEEWNEDLLWRLERNMNINIGDKVKIEATIVDYNEGAKTVKIRIEGLQEDNYTPAERYIRVKSGNFEKQ